MVYEDFLLTIQTAIKSRLGQDYTILLQKVKKNNGTVLDGLCIAKAGQRAAPTIYLNPYFDQWRSGIVLSHILDDIVCIYQSDAVFPNINPDILKDFNLLKDKIVYKLIHTRSNRERLADLPHVPYLDLSIIFYLFLEENDQGHMTATIHRSHMESWGITEDVLLTLATENTPRILPAQLKSMRDVIESLINNQPEDAFARELLREQQNAGNSSPLFVLTNDSGINGSCAMLYHNLLKNFAAQLKQDLIILPSSIHEVLLVPYSKNICLKELSDMVRFINLTEVPVEDRLSNRLYCYERSGNQVALLPRLPKYQTS